MDANVPSDSKCIVIWLQKKKKKPRKIKTHRVKNKHTVHKTLIPKTACVWKLVYEPETAIHVQVFAGV